MIDPGDKVIPGRIRVFSHATHQNVTFNTRYRGQKWRCRRCQVDHIGPCSDLQAFYASKDARAKEIINHKVLSDSTLRRVEQVGLKSDVLRMSGGGVGHLANTLRDDPGLADKDQIAVFTSRIDYRHKEYAKEGDYVFTIDKRMEKLKEGIVKTPDKHLSIFAIQDDPRKPALPPRELLREKYLLKELHELEASPQISTIPVWRHAIDTDATGHPTEEGTRTILRDIEVHYNSDLYRDDKYLTTDRVYAGVQSVFRYGCRTCDRLGRFDGLMGICDGCVQLMDGYNGIEKWESFLRSLPPEPPPTPVIDPANWRDEGDGVGQGEKRSREEDAGSDGGLVVKVQVTEFHLHTPLPADDDIDVFYSPDAG